MKVNWLFVVLGLICLNTAAVAQHAMGGGGGAKIEGVASNPCRDYASVGYQCCVYVKGNRDSLHCQAQYLNKHTNWTKVGVKVGVEALTEYLASGHLTLSHIAKSSLVGYLVADLVVRPLDLTGMSSLASGAIARCIAGEPTYRGPGVTYVGGGGYEHPLYGFGRWNQKAVTGYIGELKRDCNRYQAQLAAEEVVRPVSSTRDGEARCGSRVDTRHPRTFLEPAYTSSRVVLTRFCGGSRRYCCNLNSQWTARAYCHTSNTPNRTCTDATPPAR